jgi:hypothetical protein
MSFTYFAYGSNMLAERLLDRCPGAKVIGFGSVSGYRSAFCLMSRDGSAKAGLLKTKGGEAGGVLYSIPKSEGPALDAVEGHPHTYRRHETLEVIAGGNMYEALTYIPHDDRMAEGVAPYDWYRALCLAGAGENSVPDGLIQSLIDATPKVTDLGNAAASSGRNIAHAALIRAGFSNWVRQLV